MAHASKDTAHGAYEPYYVPEQSKFPFLASIGLFVMVYGLGNVLNDVKADASATGSAWLAFTGFFILACVLYNWFATQIRENHQGLPSAQLKRSYVLAMYWFIFSEVMFFSAFFGALFYVRNLSVPWLGGEGAKGIAAMLWPDFSPSWPVVSNPNPELFENPEASMAWPGFSEASHYLPLWSRLGAYRAMHLSHRFALLPQRCSTCKDWMVGAASRTRPAPVANA